MEHFRIRPLAEADFDAIIKEAGGRRAHPDADSRKKPGADYVLSDAIIELKSLDDEGLAKSERQTKLAALFRAKQRDRPVIVLDRTSLSEELRREYDRILEGPIKSAVSKANKQLKQSKSEITSAKASILFVVNNGYTAMDHESLLRSVAHRARQDTREIDGVVVAGVYLYCDTFDSFVYCPIDYVPINVTCPFKSYDKLRIEWHRFAESFVTRMMFRVERVDATKQPIIDIQFDVDDVTYVKPAPPFGKESDFFIHGRPRKDSTGLTECPCVARTFPDMNRMAWEQFRSSIASRDWNCTSWEDWMRERADGAASDEPVKPFVPIPVTHCGWQDWLSKTGEGLSIASVANYANELFDERVRELCRLSRERQPDGITPSRYVLVTTEVIGQDRANDVSHIALVREHARDETEIRELVTNCRIFHEHAVVLGCAYAVREDVDAVLWQKYTEYAWC